MLTDEIRHRLRHRGDSQPLPDDRSDIVSRQGIEMQLLTPMRPVEALVFIGDGSRQRTQAEHQQRPGELLGHQPGERPGGRVAPVGILHHDQQRPLLGGRPKRADEEPAGTVCAYLPLKLADERILR
jgi:hypothetical protein